MNINKNKKLTPQRKQRSIDDKYEIIMFYLSIESKGRCAKEETRRKFDLATVSSLNTILSQKDEIIRLYETNQALFIIFLRIDLIND